MRRGFRLGMFDKDGPYDQLTDEVVESPEHLALSRKMAQDERGAAEKQRHPAPGPQGQRGGDWPQRRRQVRCCWATTTARPPSTPHCCGASKRPPRARCRYARGWPHSPGHCGPVGGAPPAGGHPGGPEERRGHFVHGPEPHHRGRGGRRLQRRHERRQDQLGFARFPGGFD